MRKVHFSDFSLDCFEELIVIASVTRFGEISPIWQYSESLLAISKSLNKYYAKFDIIFDKFLCFWANFHCYKWPNNEK